MYKKTFILFLTILFAITVQAENTPSLQSSVLREHPSGDRNQ